MIDSAIILLMLAGGAYAVGKAVPKVYGSTLYATREETGGDTIGWFLVHWTSSGLERLIPENMRELLRAISAWETGWFTGGRGFVVDNNNIYGISKVATDAGGFQKAYYYETVNDCVTYVVGLIQRNYSEAVELAQTDMNAAIDKMSRLGYNQTSDWRRGVKGTYAAINRRLAEIAEESEG